ncbi:hypothetical protein B566_EDAN018961 [Ephemera danica]|nr:hypothetical protein B566_EDAN018961 [Ephemera danica]
MAFANKLITGMSGALSMIHFVLHDARDTVAVVVVEGVKAGMTLNGWMMDDDKSTSVVALQDIPIGHKVALKGMEVGSTVINLSEVARGKVMVAAKKGEPIPLGWALDAQGRPTTDATAALEGSMLPIGAATSSKGAMLALVVELLVTAVIGAQFGFEASSFFVDAGNKPRLGQAFLVIDPGALAGTEHYLDRLEVLISEMLQDEGVRLPGVRRSDLAEVALGQWPRAALSGGREAGGKTLGLIGFGSVGQLTARLARGLNMQVAAFDSMLDGDHPAYVQNGARCAGLDEVIAMSDVVSLHVPLVESTQGLFNAARIAGMKPGAVLINTARGGIVDEAALAAALRSGQLGGAAIDVFAAEPLPVAAHFQGCPNLILTPHIAGVSAESNERVSFLIAEKVLEALA